MLETGLAGRSIVGSVDAETLVFCVCIGCVRCLCPGRASGGERSEIIIKRDELSLALPQASPCNGSREERRSVAAKVAHFK